MTLSVNFAFIHIINVLRFFPRPCLHIAAPSAANSKFKKRFRAVEQALAEQSKTPEQSDLAEMDALWNKLKHRTSEN